MRRGLSRRPWPGGIEGLDWAGPTINSVIKVNPDAEAIATDLDRERSEGQVRGPLHGIPIMLKDSIATDDRMQTGFITEVDRAQACSRGAGSSRLP